MESWETGIFAFLVLACIGGAVGIYFGLKGTSEAGAIGGAVGLGITAIIVVYFWFHNSRKSEELSQRKLNFRVTGKYLTNKERQSLVNASLEKTNYIHQKELKKINEQNGLENREIKDVLLERHERERKDATEREQQAAINRQRWNDFTRRGYF